MNCIPNFSESPFIVSTDAVNYQGVEEEVLAICKGNSLTYVLNILIGKIKGFLKGEGIILEDLEIIEDEFLGIHLDGEEKNLLNILAAIRDSLQDLYEEVSDATDKLDDITNIDGYDLSCLDPEDPCGAPLDFKGLIQSLITHLCANIEAVSVYQTNVSELVSGEVKSALAGGAITSNGSYGIEEVDNGLLITGFTPPNVPVIYTGPLENFTVGGAGIPNSPYAGWRICNGSFGTPSSITLPQNVGNTITYIIRLS